MLGTSTSPGVIFRTMQDLYVRIEAAKDDVVCNVEVSYLEIYNETVRDLLRPESGILAVREDGDQGISVSGLTLHKVEFIEVTFNIILKAVFHFSADRRRRFASNVRIRKLQPNSASYRRK